VREAVTTVEKRAAGSSARAERKGSAASPPQKSEVESRLSPPLNRWAEAISDGGVFFVDLEMVILIMNIIITFNLEAQQ
jgi:hypothetical protein